MVDVVKLYHGLLHWHLHSITCIYFYKNRTRAQRSPYEAREETRVEETVSEDWSSEIVSQVILKPPDS